MAVYAEAQNLENIPAFKCIINIFIVTLIPAFTVFRRSLEFQHEFDIISGIFYRLFFYFIFFKYLSDLKF